MTMSTCVDVLVELPCLHQTGPSDLALTALKGTIKRQLSFYGTWDVREGKHTTIKTGQ